MNKKKLIPINPKSWLIAFLLWFLVGFYFILSSAVYYIDLEQAFKWKTNLISRMPSFILWGLLTPIVIHLAFKHRIEKANFYSKILIHIFMGAVFTFVHRLLSVTISYSVFSLLGESKDSLINVLLGDKFIIFSAWFDGFFIYWVFLAAIYSVDYYKSFNENRIRATQLEAKLAHAELNALKMQLQPHFLFNTLNAISVLVHKDPESADEMITRLGDLLRLTLDKFGQKKVTLKEEIDFINSYLGIQKIRYKDKLSVKMDIPTSTIDLEVPALILQPLIENSIKYAVEPSSKQTVISISAFIDKNYLNIEIKDNGPGMNGKVSEGVGIKNIKARLEQMYGDGKFFSISDSEGAGVKTTIQIPI